ncbi:MAG TPA: hypothetical protein VFP41_01190 [Actinomycetota bacterium]|nr:hypothetical protein [Actinomycetota bacterium]
MRRYTMDDLGTIWSVVEAERQRLGEWMRGVEGTTSIEDQRAWLEKVVGESEGLEGCGIFVVDELAGGIGLSWDPSAPRQRSATGSAPRSRVGD